MDNCIGCGNCYELDGVACYSILTIETGLANATAYTIFLKDRHNTYYKQSVTTNGSGGFTLDLTAFPDGMFTQHSGKYELIASLNALVPEPEVFTIGYEEYECLLINFIDIG